MSALAVELDSYLALRRSLGFKLRRAEKLLRQFVDYCDALAIDAISAELALRWATLPEDASRSWVCHRLCVVRGFSRHLALVDERHQVVPTSVVTMRWCLSPSRPASGWPSSSASGERTWLSTLGRMSVASARGERSGPSP